MPYQLAVQNNIGLTLMAEQLTHDNMLELFWGVSVVRVVEENHERQTFFRQFLPTQARSKVHNKPKSHKLLRARYTIYMIYCTETECAGCILSTSRMKVRLEVILLIYSFKPNKA